MLSSDCISSRMTLSVLGFFGTMAVYFCRLNLSIGIVAMVKQVRIQDISNNITFCTPVTKIDEFDNNTQFVVHYENQTDNVDDITDEILEPCGGDFDWSPGVQGDLLASYYYGYILTQVVGTWLATRIGFKNVWGWGMFLAAVLTLASPGIAKWHTAAFFAARILIGFFHGVTFPVFHGMLGFWAPPLERSKMVSLYCTGCSVGTCLLFPIAGVLIDTFGWESVFYFTGTFELGWCLAWYIWAFDSPRVHPRISKAERDHIETSIREGKEEDEKDADKHKDIPWKSIFTCKAVWAVSAGHLASNWGNYQLNSMLPTYLSTVLMFDIKANGILSALPFIAQSIVCMFAGWVTDFIRHRGWMKTLTVRKVNTALGLLVPATAVVLAGYMGTNASLAMMFFIISVGFNTFTVPGCKTSPLDFAPRYAGIIMGISNTVANLSGFLAPQTTGHLLDYDNSLKQWQLAFWISAMVYFPGFVIFTIWGEDQLMPWAQ